MVTHWWLVFPILALFIPKGVLLITLRVMAAIFIVWRIVRFSSLKLNRWMVSHIRVMLKTEERFG